MTNDQAKAAVQKLFESDPLELEQYGVPGMKWGVRRKTGGSSGGPRGTASKTSAASSDTFKTKLKLNSTPTGSAIIGPRKMSDAQLAAALKRLNMEKQYKDMKNPALADSKKAVREVLINSGKAVASAYVTHVLFKGTAKYTGLDLAPKKGEKKKDD